MESRRLPSRRGAVDLAPGAATPIGSFGINANKISSVWPAFDISGNLWAAVSYIPPPPPAANAFPPDWSDLARINIETGAMSVLGPITGPEDMRSVPLFGLAITPQPACPTGTATAQPVPATATPTLATLAGLLLLGGWFGLRRRTLSR